MAVTRSSAGIYSEPSFDRKFKIGYARRGAKVPVKAEALAKDNCKGGWYEAIAGGYICGSNGTTDLESREAKTLPKAPDIEAVLPFRYARNVKNGTPLYKSMPTLEQMYEYEPYLPGAEAARKKKQQEAEERAKAEAKVKAEAEARAKAEARRQEKPGDDASDESARSVSKQTSKEKTKTSSKKRTAAKGRSTRKSEKPDDESIQASAPRSDAKRDVEGEKRDGNGDAESLSAEDAAELATEQKVPWWDQEDPSLNELTHQDLEAEGDDVLAKRMVKGFYVAIDKVTRWHDRTWYVTTKGLLAPADRMSQTTGSEFKGVKLDETWKLPIGWVYGWQKSRTRFSLDEDSQQLKAAGEVKHFEAVNLTGKEVEIRGKTYVETLDGYWMRAAHLRITKPGPAPEGLGPKERWIDVNLGTQTVIAFIGEEPYYASMISSGKTNPVKEKDHGTPTGEFRIRVKHLTTTMDGDGTAWDLPYSIEDVPYVMYFHKSYALHGAFWHRNYGIKMSHGCVNLAPLDAKELFFFADPPVTEGWHGAWASEQRQGTRVVVHE